LTPYSPRPKSDRLVKRRSAPDRRRLWSHLALPCAKHDRPRRRRV